MAESTSGQFSPVQEIAIQARGMNVLVSAGAGSGKTSVLVERVVRCLYEPALLDITSLLVVTFTDAAAAEMRERIAARIITMRAAAAADGNHTLARHLARQTALLEQAQISTLHSFCMDVVRRNFFLLGLEPACELMDADASTLLRRSLLQERMEQELSQDESGDFRRMLGRFGAADPTRLFDLVLRIDAFAQSQADPEAWLAGIADHFQSVTGSLQDTVWMPPFRAMVIRKLRRAKRLCERGLELTAGADELNRYADAFAGTLELMSTIQLAENLDVFAATPTITAAHHTLSARVSAKAHPARETAKAIRKEAQDLLTSLTDVLERGEVDFLGDIQQLSPDVAILMNFVSVFATDYAVAKRAQGKLDFADLEHLALTALRHPDSGESLRLRERFAEIFVDEYQDISPIQDALVNAVTRDEGNAFVVGDVKQSIYRFRMAEPNLFLHQYQSLGRTEPGQVIDLSTNYRSRPEIVAMVNFVFSQIFQQEFGGITYDAGARMEAGANYPASQAVATELHVIESGGGDGNGNDNDEADTDDGEIRGSVDALELEATLIANRILQLIGANGESATRVFDRRLGTLRPARYSDIVILLRSAKGRVETFADVFSRAGIPVYAATSTGFYDALEIRYLIAALRALDNPRRDIDLAALLRSPLFGLTDETLGWIRTAAQGSYWEALQRAAGGEVDGLPAALTARAAEVLATIQGWRTLARSASAEAMIDRLIHDTHLLPYLLAMQGGRTRRANVERLQDDARAYDAAHYDGIFGFVKHLQRLSDEGIDVGEARTLSESENVVRVMTIHQSKGLEFPIVFVANLGKPFYQGTSEQSFPLHSDYGFGPQRFDVEHHRRWHTFPWIALTEANRLAFLAEEARVLYVALTRAKERLILVGAGRKLNRLVTDAAGWLSTNTEPLDADGLLSAPSMLSWLIGAFLRHPDAAELRALASDEPLVLHLLPVGRGTLSVQLWNQKPETEIHPVTLAEAAMVSLPESVAALDQWLAAIAPDAAVPEIQWRQATANPDIQDVPAKVSATELRRLWAQRHHEGGRDRGFGSAEKLLDDPLFIETEAALRREAGVAFHTVMQHVPFTVPMSEQQLFAFIEELHSGGVLDQRALALVNVQDILGFLKHPLGQQLRRASVIYREQPFFTRIPVGDDFITVQGVIDCLAKVDEEWLLIDYKTDQVTAASAPEQALAYQAQVATYLTVAKRLVGEAKVSAVLYFVKPKLAVPVNGMDVSELFQK